MSQPLRKFVNRSTRYFYTYNDNNYIEFSGKDKKEVVSAEVLNISATGLALIVNRRLCPEPDSLIRFECTLPSGKEFAWWGRVRRIISFRRPDRWSSTAIDDVIGLRMVGVQFENFPPEKEAELAKELDQYFNQVQKKKITSKGVRAYSFFTTHWKKLSLILGCGLIIFALFYLLSRPFLNYNSSKGSAWGERQFTPSKQ